MIVVDASLAVKWLLPESDSDAALALIDRFTGDLHGPDILLSEVAGAIIRRANQRDLPVDQAARLVRSWTHHWTAGQLVTHRLDAEMVGRAAETAIRLGHPITDCLYLALAIDLACDLATCNAKFAVKARRIYPAVKLLADYGG